MYGHGVSITKKLMQYHQTGLLFIPYFFLYFMTMNLKFLNANSFVVEITMWITTFLVSHGCFVMSRRATVSFLWCRLCFFKALFTKQIPQRIQLWLLILANSRETFQHYRFLNCKTQLITKYTWYITLSDVTPGFSQKNPKSIFHFFLSNCSSLFME